MEITKKIIKGFPSYTDSALRPQYIVLHDTAGMGSAEQEATRVQSASAYNNGVAHYYVDESSIYQVIDNKIKAYHAGDGPTGKGNGKSLAIEVCRSLYGGEFKNESDKARYKKALDNACALAYDLMQEFKIPKGNIFQHRDVRATACPYTQMVYYGSYAKALSAVIKLVASNGEAPDTGVKTRSYTHAYDPKTKGYKSVTSWGDKSPIKVPISHLKGDKLTKVWDGWLKNTKFKNSTTSTPDITKVKRLSSQTETGSYDFANQAHKFDRSYKLLEKATDTTGSTWAKHTTFTKR